MNKKNEEPNLTDSTNLTNFTGYSVKLLHDGDEIEIISNYTEPISCTPGHYCSNNSKKPMLCNPGTY